MAPLGKLSEIIPDALAHLIYVADCIAAVFDHVIATRSFSLRSRGLLLLSHLHESGLKLLGKLIEIFSYALADPILIP